MANEGHHYKAGEWALWAQPGGPGTTPLYLGCHALGDISEPMGDTTLIYCPAPEGPSRFRVTGSVQGAAGAVTTTLTTDVTEDIQFLETIRCTFPLYAVAAQAGRRDVFTNYERAFVLTNSRITSRGLTAISARTPDDDGRSEQTFDISAEELLRIGRLSVSRQTVSTVPSVNDITFCNSESCATSSTPASAVCQSGFATQDPAAGVAPVVLVTTNGGTWAAAASSPFLADEVAGSIECFEMGASAVRVIVARGATKIATAAEIAYSDDSGANWTKVLVGAQSTTFAPMAGSLFALDRNNIWMGGNTGYLYKSEDGGATWAVKDAGVLQVGAWNGIHFSDEDTGWIVGAANEIDRTTDGGSSWSAITGPAAQNAVAINTVFSFDRNRAWIGYADGKLYFTIDGGVTWTQRSFSGSGVGQVRSIEFANEYVGVLAHNNASPVGRVLYTFDGGFTWEALTTPTNVGLNSVHICDEHKFFVAGEAVASTGFIAAASMT